MPDGDAVFGPRATVDRISGQVLTSGPIDGSLVLELVQDDHAQMLMTMAFAIVAAETVRHVAYMPHRSRD
jgi:hypothetical protein